MKMLSKFALLLASTASTLAARGKPGSDGSAWTLQQFSNLIVFGDSYSDESRLKYFLAHNNTLPPPGTVLPEAYNTASGGRIWNRYVVQYTGQATKTGRFAPQINLYNYAYSGGVCSNNITPRNLVGTSTLFPSILEDQFPSFAADLHATNPATNKSTFAPSPLTADNTLYVVWTGGNDLGEAAFFTDSQVRGTTIVDYLDCVYRVMDGLYELGARYFVLPNQPPFDLTPLYANDTEGGINAAQGKNYWPLGKPDNHTAVAAKMQEYIVLANDAFHHRTPYYTAIAQRYPGARFAVWDLHTLFYNIHENPGAYLNGTRTPYNTSATATGICTVKNGTCVDAGCCDSFMYFDSLHKSEQTDRVMARDFVQLMGGNSSYATYW